MKPLTIKDLYKECKKQIDNGNGDKVIMISNDDEGNGYHYLWYSFTTKADNNKMEIELANENAWYKPLGFKDTYGIDESIASENDTIILG